MVSDFLHNLPFMAGLILVALGLGGRVPLITGIVLIVLGVVFR